MILKINFLKIKLQKREKRFFEFIFKSSTLANKSSLQIKFYAKFTHNFNLLIVIGIMLGNPKLIN